MDLNIARCALVLFALFFGVDRAVANEKVSVGACPLVIELSLKGEWEKARLDPRKLEALSSNKNRNAVIAAVYSLPDDPLSPSFVYVSSLGSLEKHQGQLGQTQFDDLAHRYMGLKQKIPAEANNYIKSLERGSARDISVTKFTIADVERRGNSVVLYGFVNAVVEARAVTVVSVQRTIFLHGCIITLQFGFPSSAYSFRDIQKMVWDVQLR